MVPFSIVRIRNIVLDILLLRVSLKFQVETYTSKEELNEKVCN